MRSNHSLIWAKAGPVEVRYKWKAKPAQTFAVEIYVAIIIMWQMTCCVGVVLGLFAFLRFCFNIYTHVGARLDLHHLQQYNLHVFAYRVFTYIF